MARVSGEVGGSRDDYWVTYFTVNIGIKLLIIYKIQSFFDGVYTK